MMTDDEEFFFLNNLFLKQCPLCGMIIDEDARCVCEDYYDDFNEDEEN